MVNLRPKKAGKFILGGISLFFKALLLVAFLSVLSWAFLASWLIALTPGPINSFEDLAKARADLANAKMGISALWPQGNTDDAVVSRVVDGDTFVTADGTIVRLIGVDAPESVSPDKEKNVAFGKIATDYTAALIEGKTVRLETDVAETDRYGRLLAYVYMEGGEMANRRLVEEGYARAMAVPPNVAHEKEFEAAAKAAREAGLGVWEDYENIFPA
jgi:micrococcal nuclease